MQVPGYNIPEVEKNFIRAMRVEGIDKFYPGPDKAPPLPNPKAQLEELKLKGKTMQFQHEKQMFIVKLMEERRVNSAKIMQLEAQAASLIAGIGAEQAGLQLEAFNSAVAAMQAHNDMLNQSIETMQGGSENGEGGGVPGMAAAPSDPSLLAGAGGMGSQPEGPMGDGQLPE
jgi:hypothetical protein